MQNRVPVRREDRAVALDFEPVPRKYRHDGWTPERQRAFIEALADTGCVSRAAGMVNMAQANCYTLRRAPGAEGFRRAWHAALDFGLGRLKDIAFERAIEGQLVPRFVGGKLMGFERKRNDALLMFCLRHYGQDANGRRVTVNYFSTRASAGGAGGEGAEASTTTVRTTVTGGDAIGANGGGADGDAARTLAGFEGVALDAEAQASIAATLEACAARARDAEAAQAAGGEGAVDAVMLDGGEPFVPIGPTVSPYRGELESPVTLEEWTPFTADEPHWTLAGAVEPPLLQVEAVPAPASSGAAVKRRPGRRKAAG